VKLTMPPWLEIGLGNRSYVVQAMIDINRAYGELENTYILELQYRNNKTLPWYTLTSSFSSSVSPFSIS